MDDWDVIVIGAGAAGLMAASRAAQRGRRTLLLERKKRPGAKILMSGGARCNITHAVDARGIVEAYGEQGQFLHSALAAQPSATCRLNRGRGRRNEDQPTGKIFPVSDRAGDVLAALMAILRRSGCTLAFDEPVLSIAPHASELRVVTAKRTLMAESLIVTTGGKSFPSSGSTGDGYAWAADLGHAIVPTRPALVPITSPASWVRDLQGITLADIRVAVVEVNNVADSAPECLMERRGSLLFTHFGVSGPAVLDVSRAISGHPLAHRLSLRCDLLPGSNTQLLEAEIQEQCQQAGGRLAAAVVARLVPQRLAEMIMVQSGIGRDRRAAEISRTERQNLVAGLKNFKVPVSGTLGFNKAEVTAGGVALGEVDSRTMESRMTPGLFLAGEILDLDGPIGGYNFQAAFSTGWLAGENA